jgi:uncharacterized protein YdiU (UPF0061 family)
MENIADLIKIFSSLNQEKTQEIPKEIEKQYPYGQFPIKYTKSGQENIRKQSESRYSNTEHNKYEETTKDNLGLETILPFIQLMTTGKKNNKDMMGILSKLLFKDKPELQKLFNLLPNTKQKNQEIKSNEQFPDTNKIKISSLKRVD